MRREAGFLATYASPLGGLRITGRGEGISAISIISGKSLTGKLPFSVRRRLDIYFKGSAKTGGGRFLLEGTPFQRNVWKALLSIPWGESVSYTELARRVKRPQAVRAVANAVGKNPVAILIPCHRVIGSDGALTGYAYGLKKKKWLLLHEKKRRG